MTGIRKVMKTICCFISISNADGKLKVISSVIEAQNNLHGRKQTIWSSWHEESIEKQTSYTK